ncbi:MAG: protein jag [Selenomonadaceae bacterium]|nr:protein jag [Selenomonadaceae bacterium]
MAKTMEKTAKTVEDALKAALDELGVNENDVNYEVVEEPSRGFLGLIGNKPAKIRVTVKENIKIENNDSHNSAILKSSNDSKADINEAIHNLPEEVENEPNANDDENDETKITIVKQFLQDIFNSMHLNVIIEEKSLDDCYVLNLQGENLGILIGKHGQTLDALQYLVNLVANRNRENKRTRFIIDVENYRNRRAETLQNLAKNLAERAVRMNQDVRLEPMSRHERKVIHSSLQNNSKVFTHSAGEEPYRYIIISPKRYGKRKYNDSSNNKNKDIKEKTLSDTKK